MSSFRKTKRKEYYSIKEVASILNVNKGTVQNWVDYGLLFFVVDEKGVKKIPFETFIKFLKINHYKKLLESL